MNLGILFAILAMLGFGLSSSFAKKPSNVLGPTKSIVIRNLGTVIILIPIAIIPLIKIKPTPLQLILATAIGIFGYIPLLYFYKALQKGRLGIVIPLTRTSIIWTIFLSMIILQEFISFKQAITVTIIIIGTILLTKKPNTKLLTKYTLQHGAKEALITGFLWAIWYVLYKFPIQAIGPFPAAFCLELGVLIGALIHFGYENKDKLFSKKKDQFVMIHQLKNQDTFFASNYQQIKPIIFELIGTTLCAAMATTTLVFAIKFSKVSIVTAITGASPLIAIAYGHMRLHEKFTKQEIIGASIAILGVILLALV
jgi:drug/metabolite transporter (DMT)-like permease